MIRRTHIMRRAAVALALCASLSAALLLFAAVVPAPSAAITAADIKPPIVKKYISFGAVRRAQMADYSQHHYHQHTTWLAKPKVVVIHHTAGAQWQSAWWTFQNNTAYNNEKPGVVAHFIIAKDGTIYQCLPLYLRGRHAIGMNWTAIGIEFVQESAKGKDAHWMDRQILARDKQALAGVRLVRYLKLRFAIKNTNVIGHAMADASPFFKDYTGAKNYAGDWYAPEVKLFRARL
jgi:N-acetyl-anhydromuramyl-L-alanine amidase AmpD